MRRAFFILLTLLLSTTFVFAAEFGPVCIEGQHIIKNDEEIKTGRHTFILTAKEDAPMPAGSVNGVKKITINSGEKFSFGNITYQKPGVYEYKVSREIKKSKNLKQDNSVYEAQVVVQNGTEPVIVFKKIGTEGKPNKIAYSDTYVKEKVNKVVKTGEQKTGLIIIFALASIVAIIKRIVSNQSKSC